MAGRGLGKPGLTLEVDGAALVMDDVIQRDSALEIPLDAATFGGSDLAIGVHRLQAIAPKAGPDLPEHLRERSNALAFALGPAIAIGAVNAPPGGPTATGSVEIDFTPAVGAAQSVRLLLDSRDENNPAHVVLPGREPDAGAAQATLSFSFTDLPRGRWLVRADVDGLLSPVTIDSTAGSPTFGQILGPELTL